MFINEVRLEYWKTIRRNNLAKEYEKLKNRILDAAKAEEKELKTILQPDIIEMLRKDGFNVDFVGSICHDNITYETHTISGWSEQ